VRKGHRERPLQVAAADAGIDAVERGRSDPNPDLSLAGNRLFDVLVTQDPGVAGLMKTNRLRLQASLSLEVALDRPGTATLVATGPLSDEGRQEARQGSEAYRPHRVRSESRGPSRRRRTASTRP